MWCLYILGDQSLVVKRGWRAVVSVSVVLLCECCVHVCVRVIEFACFDANLIKDSLAHGATAKSIFFSMVIKIYSHTYLEKLPYGCKQILPSVHPKPPSLKGVNFLLPWTEYIKPPQGRALEDESIYSHLGFFLLTVIGCLLNIVDRALLRGHQTTYEHESVQSWWPIAARALIDCWYRRLKTVGRHSFDCWQVLVTIVFRPST